MKRIALLVANTGLITAGFAITALGLILMLHSGLGMGPWGALEVSLSGITGLSVGQVTQLISLSLAGVSWLMKIPPSVTTILNMFFIGFFMDMFIGLIPVAGDIGLRIAFFITGLLTYSFGISFYLSFALISSGPRESFMLGLSKTLKTSVRLSRIVIDMTVLIVALVIGGPIGVGTIFFAFSAGPLIQAFLKLRGFRSEGGRIIHIHG